MRLLSRPLRGQSKLFEEAVGRLEGFVKKTRIHNDGNRRPHGHRLQEKHGFFAGATKGFEIEIGQIRSQQCINSIRFVIYYILLINEHFFDMLNMHITSMIIFGRTSYWKTILELLKARFPHLPELETKQGTYKDQWTLGLGTVSAAREFFRKNARDYKVQFIEESWRGQEIIGEDVQFAPA